MQREQEHAVPRWPQTPMALLLTFLFAVRGAHGLNVASITANVASGSSTISSALRAGTLRQRQEPPPGLDLRSVGAPAPASAPAAAARLPSATLQKVAGGLAAETKLLSNVSAELLSLGAEVDGTEQALLGRVLDVQGARGLLTHHDQIENANDWSADHLSDLRGQAEALYVDLGKVGHEATIAGKARREEQHRMEAELAAQQAEIQRLRTLASKLPAEEEEHASLEKEQKRAQDADALYQHDIDQKLKELAAVRAEIKAEMEEEARLEQIFLTEEQRSAACNAKAKTNHAELRALLAAAPKTTAAELAASRQATQLATAATQRLRAESALLVAEVVRNEQLGQQALLPLQEEHQKLELLGQQLVTEVKNLSTRMSASKARALTLQQESEANVGKGDEASGRIRGLDEQLRGLHQRISPVVYAALEAENKALTEELTQATIMLMQSKTVEAQLHANASQSEAELEAQKKTTELVAEQAKLAHEDGKKQLEEALKKSAEVRRKAKALEEKADSVIAERCKEKWEDRAAAKQDELAHCKQLKEELSVVEAQADMLKATLQAKQTASAAAEGGEAEGGGSPGEAAEGQ